MYPDVPGRTRQPYPDVPGRTRVPGRTWVRYPERLSVCVVLMCEFAWAQMGRPLCLSQIITKQIVVCGGVVVVGGAGGGSTPPPPPIVQLCFLCVLGHVGSGIHVIGERNNFKCVQVLGIARSHHATMQNDDVLLNLRIL